MNQREIDEAAKAYNTDRDFQGDCGCCQSGFKAGAAWERERMKHIIELDRQHCNRLQDLTERCKRLRNLLEESLDHLCSHDAEAIRMVREHKMRGWCACGMYLRTEDDITLRDRVIAELKEPSATGAKEQA